MSTNLYRLQPKREIAEILPEKCRNRRQSSKSFRGKYGDNQQPLNTKKNNFFQAISIFVLEKFVKRDTQLEFFLFHRL